MNCLFCQNPLTSRIKVIGGTILYCGKEHISVRYDVNSLELKKEIIGYWINLSTNGKDYLWYFYYPIQHSVIYDFQGNTIKILDFPIKIKLEEAEIKLKTILTFL